MSSSPSDNSSARSHPSPPSAASTASASHLNHTYLSSPSTTRDRYASTDDHPDSQGHGDSHLHAHHHPLHSLQPRPILKSDRNLSRSAAHLRWDEDTIRLHDTERGTRMKIDEPKTPWTRADHSLEQVNGGGGDGGGIPPLDLMEAMDVDPKKMVPSAIKDREQEAAAAAAKDEWSDEDDEEEHLDEEALEHKRQFEKMRAQHYNMKEALERAKWLAEHEDQEDDEEDGDQDDDDESEAEISIRVPPVPPLPGQYASSSGNQ